VSVLAPAGSTLARAFVAALAEHGWATVVGTRVPDGSGLRRAHLVVAEDDTGSRRLDLPAALARPGLVVVASLRALPPLVPLVARGALVLDRAAPFLTLVRLADEGLRGTRRGDADAARRRVDEHEALRRLTPAERETLRGLESGLAAAAIAARTQHSLHTVRSHIRAVLAKLGVTSQLAAVAVAHRAGPDWHRSGGLDHVIFGDVPAG
jgi:DNA-binding CsgD family transcriptional regulator